MTFQELGQAIRQKREAMGLSIDDVAARIKISSRILRSIEDGSSDGLPHAVYTKSFARSFGQQVGYDPAELSAALESVFPPEIFEEHKMESVLNKNASESYPGTLRRIVALLALLLFLGCLGGGVWYVAVNYGDRVMELVKQPFSAKSPTEDNETTPSGSSGNSTESSAVDSALYVLMNNGAAPPPSDRPASRTQAAVQAPADSPASAGVVASGPELENKQPGAPDGNATLPGPGAPDKESVETAAATDGAVAAESAAEARGAFIPGGKNQLLFTVVEACWVSSRADGARGRDYTLKPGERFALSYAENLEVTLGNAGGVTLEHNGKKLGAPGRRGQRVVLRFPAAAN